MNIEVCIDNIESLHIAIQAGANRIELCSALALGGISPSIGFVKKALELSTVPVFIMVRPRAGDFLFNSEEIDLMTTEIEVYKSLGAHGIVIGVLNSDSTINEPALKQMISAAKGMGVTFHRAFDLVANPYDALEVLIQHGCDRVLTSGQQANAQQGSALIKELVDQAERRISIMPGCGVNETNAADIIKMTGADEIHLSGKSTRKSRMETHNQFVSMGSQSIEELIDMTDFHKVNSVVRIFNE